MENKKVKKTTKKVRKITKKEAKTLKKINWIKVILIVLVCVFFLYKGTYMYVFNQYLNDNKVVNNYDFKNKYTIHTIKLDDKDYLRIGDNIKIKNVFNNFTSNTLSNGTLDLYTYYLKDKNGIKASMYVTTISSLIDEFVNDPDNYFQLIDSSTRRMILDRHNIKNDIDFVKYTNQLQIKNNSIITSKKTMIERYAISVFLNTMINETENMFLFDGDYEGYGVDSSFTIVKDNKRYIFSFNKGNYFTDTDIMNLLNSIVIE